MTDQNTLEVIAGETFAPAKPEHVQLTHMLYGLHAVGLVIGAWSQAATMVGAFVFGWTSIIAIIINYVKRDDVKGTILESHFTWQADTFWRCLIVMLIGIVLYLLLIGIFINWLIFAVVGFWSVYRIVRGWLALQERKPIR